LKIAITADPEIPVPPVLYGGIERIIYMLIIELIEAGHDVTLFAHKDSNVPCLLIPYTTTTNSWPDIIRNSWLISKMAFKNSFDIIHSFGRLAYLIPLMPLKVPILMSYQREPTIKQIKKAVMLSKKGSIAFTGCSDYISNKIRPYANVATVYNGVNLMNYNANEKISDDPPLVFLGRIEYIKGVHTAIEIARKVQRRLIIAGNIPSHAKEYYEQKVKPYLDKNIEYIGPVDDQQKNDLLNGALGLLMPIHWDEPFGIVMIEAMACGTPVIGFKRGAVPEVVIDGFNGYIVSDEQDAVNKINKLASLDRTRIRKYILNRFSSEIISEQYILLYKKLKKVMGDKKVIVGCGTKFHSDYMAFQLNKHDLLYKVVTAHPKDRYLNRVNLDKGKVKFLFPFFALSFFIQKITRKPNSVSKFLDYRFPKLFDQLLSKQIKDANISITWAWAGLQTINKIKDSGGIAIVEECGSCNLQQNRILAEEYLSLNLIFKEPTPNYIVNRELNETRAADYILCPSKYVANSFINQGISPEKCIIIPYGVNLNLFHNLKKKHSDFQILFVGTIGVRKGLIYLFKALEILKKNYAISCLLIGGIEEQFQSTFDRYKHLFTHINRVKHEELINYYSCASVFVFPSIDEGMAYVQLEAMACGVPVICTPNSGGDSVIDDNFDGFVVPVRDVNAIVDKVVSLFTNDTLRNLMSLRAEEKARKFTWDAYGKKLSTFINSL
jgi:glycosyltransferase involved in cell wall biosynthesis